MPYGFPPSFPDNKTQHQEADGHKVPYRRGSSLAHPIVLDDDGVSNHVDRSTISESPDVLLTSQDLPPTRLLGPAVHRVFAVSPVISRSPSPPLPNICSSSSVTSTSFVGSDDFVVDDFESGDSEYFVKAKSTAKKALKAKKKDRPVFKRESGLVLRAIQIPPRNFPESEFRSEPDPDEKSERDALETLLRLQDVANNSSYEDSKFTSLYLTDFCVYEPICVRQGNSIHFSTTEFVSLQESYSRSKEQTYFFDGTLHAAGRSIKVRRVPFRLLSIGGLCDLSKSTVGNDLWLASTLTQNQNVWYRLGTPDAAYRRFYEPFLWYADLCKHVIDYLDDRNNEQVALSDFTSDFFSHLKKLHNGEPKFEAWLSQCGTTDLRRAVTSCTEFLWAQANDVGFGNNALWQELTCRSLSFKTPRQLKTGAVPPTVVTPYVYSCFKNTWFGSLLKSVDPIVSSPHQSIWDHVFEHYNLRSSRSSSSPSAGIQVGDVIATIPDSSEVTNWKSDRSALWYAYVQEVKEVKGRRLLDLLWMDAPAHTTISTTPYAEETELFLTDHCNCKDNTVFPESDVAFLPPVAFFSTASPPNGFFVRQMFSREDSSFRTLQPDHFICSHRKTLEKYYEAGATVLATNIDPTAAKRLEPVILMESTKRKTKVLVRRFHRKAQLFPPASANELIYSETILSISVSSIARTCHVRRFDPGTKVPVPYSCGGVGNLFFVRFSNVEGRLQNLSTGLDFAQGPDFSQRLDDALQCLDLFCGSGNFGFGIEESGAAVTRYAVDLDQTAIHTKKANCKDHDLCKFYWGSVDDFLNDGLKGRWKEVPRPGEVDLIVAGSPCQGFSLMNKHKGSAKSLKNISLIASLMAYTDFYRPKYLLMENVFNMARNDKTTNQNAMSYIIACLVGMGYQVQQFNFDACTEGAPQSRSRIILAATAPGLTPLSAPGSSHAYMEGVPVVSLGRAPNGEPFGMRDAQAPKAFDIVTIAEATAHLPQNIDGRLPQVVCPDHVLASDIPYHQRMLIEYIPRLRGANAPLALSLDSTPQVIKDMNGSILGNSERGDIRKSRCLARLPNHGLSPIILASYAPTDSRVGLMVHWHENRPLTIEEARIAQQFPHDFVMLGSKVKRWRMVGNAVPRGLSQALGISLRQALETDRKKKGCVVKDRKIEETNAKCGLDSVMEGIQSIGLVKGTDQWSSGSISVDTTVQRRLHKRKRMVEDDGSPLVTVSESEREELTIKRRPRWTNRPSHDPRRNIDHESSETKHQSALLPMRPSVPASNTHTQDRFATVDQSRLSEVRVEVKRIRLASEDDSEDCVIVSSRRRMS